jgi:hypothetical protein
MKKLDFGALVLIIYVLVKQIILENHSLPILDILIFCSVIFYVFIYRKKHR